METAFHYPSHRAPAQEIARVGVNELMVVVPAGSWLALVVPQIDKIGAQADGSFSIQSRVLEAVVWNVIFPD